MELDDLKDTWNSMDTQADTKQNLTPEKIYIIIKKEYSSRINRIIYPEIVGIIICLGGAIFIGVNFSNLTTTFLQTIGIVSILLLLTLSIISLLSLQRLVIKRDINTQYAETLRIFAKQKFWFYKLQKANVILSYLLLITVVILLPQIVNGKDISNNKYFWIFSFSFGYIFLSFYTKWIAKSYKKTLSQAEELLSELQS